MLIKKVEENGGAASTLGFESFVVLEFSDYLVLCNVVLIVLALCATVWFLGNAVRSCWQRRGGSQTSEIKKKKE